MDVDSHTLSEHRPQQQQQRPQSQLNIQQPPRTTLTTPTTSLGPRTLQELVCCSYLAVVFISVYWILRLIFPIPPGSGIA